MERDVSTSQHVLVIGVDHSTIELYRAILEEGDRVSAASSPMIELAELIGTAPDLILLDLRFCVATHDRSLLAQLKATLKTRPIPVLVCSADHQQLADRHDQLLAWDSGILTKPFDLADLLAAVPAGLTADELSLVKTRTVGTNRHDMALPTRGRLIAMTVSTKETACVSRSDSTRSCSIRGMAGSPHHCM